MTDPRPLDDRARDLGLLLLRVGAALLIWTFHMRPKLADFDQEWRDFPDPIGLGSPFAFVLALLSEGVCSLLVALGLLTRLAALPIVATMAMVLLLALRGFAGADVQSALLYALPYAVLALTGPGRLALDHRLQGRYRRWLARLTGRPAAGA